MISWCWCGRCVQAGGGGDYRDVDFGKGPRRFEASVAAAVAGGVIELHVDSLGGRVALCFTK